MADESHINPQSLPDEPSTPAPPLDDHSHGAEAIRQRNRVRFWFIWLLVSSLVVGSLAFLRGLPRDVQPQHGLKRTEQNEAPPPLATNTDDGLRAEMAATKKQVQDANERVAAYQMATRYRQVASLYSHDPLSALNLLHDDELFPIDQRDPVWNYYARVCERRLRPDMLGKVLATAVHGRRYNVFPVAHRDAEGRVPALVETPDATWSVMDLASGIVIRATHADLKQRGQVVTLSGNGRIAGVWVKGTPVKNEKTGHIETPTSFQFVDVETGQPLKLRLDSSQGFLTPDGQRFFTQTPTDRILYDVVTGAVINKVAHSEPIERLDSTSAISANGKYIATFVRSEKTPGIVRIIDAQTGKEINHIVPPNRHVELIGKRHAITDPEAKLGVELLQFSPDGQKLAIVYRYYGQISIPEYFAECHIVSVPDGVQIGVHGVVNSEFPTCVAFDQTGTQIAVACSVGSGNGGARGTFGVYRTDPTKKGDLLLPVVQQFAWPVPTPHPLMREAKGGDRGLIRGLSFAPNGTQVAVATQTDGGYHVIDADLLTGRIRQVGSSLPHVFGQEKVDANAHFSSRDELFVVSEFDTWHRWRLQPDDAIATLLHRTPHDKLRHTDTRIAFGKGGSALFVRYFYDHWHNGSDKIAQPPVGLTLHWEQHNMQSYSRIESLEPPLWKATRLTDPSPLERLFPANEPLPPAVSPDGRLRVTTKPNGDVEWWDVRTDTLRATLASHGHPVKAFRFSSNGQAFATLDTVHVVKLWEMSEPALYGQWRGTAATFSPDEQTIAIGGHLVRQGPLKDFKTVQFVDLKTGRPNGAVKCWGEPYSLSYSSDGETLAILDDGDARFVERQEAGWKEVTFDGYTHFPGTKRVFLPEGRMLVMMAGDVTGARAVVTTEQAHVQQAGTDRLPLRVLLGKLSDIDSFDIHRIAIGYRPEDKSVVVIQPDFVRLTVSRFDATTGKRTAVNKVPLKSLVERLWAVSPNSEYVVATNQTTGDFLKQTSTLQLINVNTGQARALAGVHTGGCANVTVSANGQWLASVDALGVVRIWNASHAQLTYEFWAHGNNIQRLALSPTGRYLAVTSNDNQVQVWNLTVILPHGTEPPKAK